MADFFKDIPHIKYKGSKSTDPFSFKYYDPDRMIDSKPMREHLKFALSYWHTMCAAGTDMFGGDTADKSFGQSDPMAHARAKAHAAFELMDKLSIDYFCFHDRDIAPEGSSLKESNGRLDEISDLLSELMSKSGKKLLWGTANCFGNRRYVHGAGTSPNPEVFAFAAAQIKKAMEITVKLGGSGYVFWGGREGYDTLLNTDMALELENMARLLKMTSDYARKIGFKGDFYIEPKPKEPTKHQYDFDAATVAGFLFKHGLDKDFKLNIEVNHATLAYHTPQHELETARINGLFGSIDANQGDMLLGWDTDQFPTDIYIATLCMLEVIKAGGFTNGGLNFDAKARRGSFTPEDIALSYIAGIDTFAFGFMRAMDIVADGRIDDFVKRRYAGYKTGIGADIVNGKATVEQLEKFALEAGDVTNVPSSGRQEMLESILNTIILEGALK